MEISQDLFIIFSIFSLLGLIFGAVSLIISICSFVECRSLSKSTHKIQYMPVPSPDNLKDEYQDSDWATTEESLKKQDKLFKDDLEEVLPDFYETDKDKKVRIF